MSDDFNGFQDGLYDFDHNGRLDDFERNVKLDDYLQAFQDDSGNTYTHRSGKGGTAFLVIALIVLCIPGCTLIGLLLLYLWWFFTKVA